MEDVLKFLMQRFGIFPVLMLIFALFLVAVCLLIAFVLLGIRSNTRCHKGLLVGFGVGLCASACWLVIPYLGAYPNLPALAILLMFSPPVDTLAEELFIHAVNFTLWPMVGWGMFRAQHNTPPWRSDPMLNGRFHPENPDDLQVIVHDGGPRFTKTLAELVWVTAIGKHGKAYRGKVLNQTQGLKSVKHSDEILFIAVEDSEHPIQVSEKYLDERDDWVIRPCNKCGFAELFDAPSDLLKKVFPNVGKNRNEQMEAFTSFCPMCGGEQVIHILSKGSAS